MRHFLSFCAGFGLFMVALASVYSARVSSFCSNFDSDSCFVVENNVFSATASVIVNDDYQLDAVLHSLGEMNFLIVRFGIEEFVDGVKFEVTFFKV